MALLLIKAISKFPSLQRRGQICDSKPGMAVWKEPLNYPGCAPLRFASPPVLCKEGNLFELKPAPKRNLSIASLLLLCLFLFLSPISLAQPRFIPLNVDYAVFNAESETEYVEIYFSFLQQSLAYQLQDSSYIANFSARIIVTANDSIFFEDSRNFYNTVDNPAEISTFREFQYNFACQLAPGKYTVKIVLTDQNSASQGEYILDLSVANISNNLIEMSDIQLAAKIEASDNQTEFTKNGLLVVPNPSGTFHIGLPVLYFYAEVYNLPFSDGNPEFYSLESFISDIEGTVVRTFPKKRQQKPGKSVVLVGGNNIVTLNSAPHFLYLKFTDETSGQVIEKRKRFNLYKPSAEQIARAKAAAKDTMLSSYVNFTIEQLDKEFAITEYLSTKEEQNLYEKLETTVEKARYLSEFWKKRDPNDSTPQNEFKENYFRRVQLANTSFRTAFKEGWKTDRGRVLLLYSEPDEINRSPSTSSTKSYEIWTYNDLDGGSIFVFADLQGFGNFELLHSTYRKELSRPNWETLIDPTIIPGLDPGF